jgi:hypothetical protein
MRFLKLHTLFFVAVVLVAGYAAVVSLRSQAPLGGRLLPPAALAASAPTATPAAGNAAVPNAVVAASPTASAANDPATAAIKSVVEKANQEQVDAFTKNDPTIMRDTATSDYYDQLVQINRDLADSGVAGIKLVKLEWGPVTLSGASGAQATTYETWRTSYSDGTTDDSRDRNVYTLVQQQGTWKIQADDHPDSDLGQAPDPTSPVTSPQPDGTTPGTIPPVRIPSGSPDVSRNWSGYAATGGTFTSVTGTWTVPQSNGATAPSGSGSAGIGSPSTGTRRGSGGFASSATWVGIGGVRSRDLIQAGTEDTTNSSGRVRYDAWIELLPQNSHPIQLAVSPGNSITVTITEQGTGQWKIAFANNTTGKSYETTVQYTSSHSSAEWVQEAPSARRTVVPLDNFGTVQFSGGSAVKDGTSVTIAESGARAVTLVDPRGSTVAKPSALTADGKGFSITESVGTASTSGSGRGAFPSSPSLPSDFPKFDVNLA